jgi:hypothetical protein
MATTAQRRQRKQVTFLYSLALHDRSRFEHEWNKRVVSWLYEINRRGTLLSLGETQDASADRVFDVVEQAERLIEACEVENMVGTETRRILTNQCCKIVAHFYGSTMHRLVNHRWYSQMRTVVRS